GVWSSVVREFDLQIPQLTPIDFRWRLGHEVHATIVFREGHDIADGFGATDDHDEAVEAEGDSAVGRRAEAQRAQQMAELRLSILRTDPERFEHSFLQLRLVDAHAAAADLNAVQHHVVSFGANLAEFFLFEQRQVFGFWPR